MLSVFESKQTRTPVWAMRQAGRYLPEYMAYTKGTNFFDNCQTPDRACEITLQPRRLDIDAAILFSDILIIPQALGMIVRMDPGKGPQFDAPLTKISDITPVTRPIQKKLPDLDIKKSFELTWDPKNQVGPKLVESLSYTRKAIKLIREKLNNEIPLIGFTGAPWTLMCYMIEGVSKASYAGVRRWFYECPQEAKNLLGLVTNACISLLMMQIESGAQMIQLFESHGGEITPECYADFELPCLRLIAETLKKHHPTVPVILFGRNLRLETLELTMSSTAFDAYSFDCNTDMTAACELAKKYNKVVQGNFDPCILFSPISEIKEKTTAMLTKVADVMGVNEHGIPNHYIANLGCVIYYFLLVVHLKN